MQKLEPSLMTSINISTIEALALTFSDKPEQYMPWLSECCKGFELSKTLLFLIILQSFTNQMEDPGSFSALFRTCFPVVKNEWIELDSRGGNFSSDEKKWTRVVYDTEKLNKGCEKFLGQLINSDSKTTNAELLICIYWRMLNGLISRAPLDTPANDGEWLRTLDDLFVLLASSHFKNVFKEHLHLLVMKCTIYPASFLSKIFTGEGFPVAVQVESLLCFATICSELASSKKSRKNINMQLLHEFPSILVPLSSDNKV
ncbi:hypothetical protein GIB67_008616 [Kingdonia uniflora]|uniref:At3g06530-like ARM-repeats domain-containing protein n=1 Tax=Kingdonia uniflora TaxID=39325 RepID=A0A7J7M4U4_9MAGN|nr:hypothetical protein GIB67_008616 [Kingdonia uniflora]